MVISDFILFIVTPTAPSSFLESSSDQSGYESSINKPDSDDFDLDFSPMAPPSYSDLSMDQSGYESSINEPDSDNNDPDFPEDGYWRH